MSREKAKDDTKPETNEEPNKDRESAEEEIPVDAEPSVSESYEEKISSLEKQLNEFRELALRKAAEFENYKRRTENDQLNLIKYAAESLIIKLLPVIDDLERSLAHMTEESDVQKIKEGIQLVYNKFIKTLEDQGVKKIEAAGKPFDVEYHEALLQRPDESVPPHTVLDELETGYIYKDRVIRHSKVIVSGE